jgi:hypothetical protein
MIPLPRGGAALGGTNGRRVGAALGELPGVGIATLVLAQQLLHPTSGLTVLPGHFLPVPMVAAALPTSPQRGPSARDRPFPGRSNLAARNHLFRTARRLVEYWPCSHGSRRPGPSSSHSSCAAPHAAPAAASPEPGPTAVPERRHQAGSDATAVYREEFAP